MSVYYYKRKISKRSVFIHTDQIFTHIFMHEMVQRIHDMSISIEKQLKDARENSTYDSSLSIKGIGYVEIQPITIKMSREYYIYLQRYGPPPDLEFDENILNQIRLEICNL